ncbi:lactonase family protein [Paenibacillus sp. CAU 1782]
MSKDNQTLYVFAGSYASREEQGVKVYKLDEETGALTLQSQYAGLQNPTFVNVDAENKLLYAISEAVDGNGVKSGEAASFRIDAATGALTPLNTAATVQNTTCHIQRDARNRYLTVTSYHGGMTGLLAINEDGSIGNLLDVKQHEGRGPHPNQDRPHPHSSFYSPNGNYLYVQDLGLDIIAVYLLDAENGKLELQSKTKLEPGAGPRHLVFHPTAPFVYVINELNSTVTVLRHDAQYGSLEALHSYSTLPEGFSGENGCAEIAISRDGNYLYGSNRGHDSIVVYKVNRETGGLETVQHVSTGGGHPRHFALTPNGNWLLAANRDGNNIVTFRVDTTSGKLEPAGHEVSASKPVCVIPVYL